MMGNGTWSGERFKGYMADKAPLKSHSNKALWEVVLCGGVWCGVV